MLDVATSNYYVDEQLGLQYLKHVRQQLFIMLQIGVHHGNEWRTTRQDSFDAGGSKAAAPNSLNASHSAIETSKSADGIERTILRVVIDENRLPIDASQRCA